MTDPLHPIPASTIAGTIVGDLHQPARNIPPDSLHAPAARPADQGETGLDGSGAEALDALILRFQEFILRAEAVQRTDGPAPLRAVIGQVTDQLRSHLADADHLRSLTVPRAAAQARDHAGGAVPSDAVDSVLAATRVAEQAIPGEFATGAAPVTDARHAQGGRSGLSSRMLASDTDAADQFAHELAMIAEQAETILAGARDGRFAPLAPIAQALRSASDRVRVSDTGGAVGLAR